MRVYKQDENRNQVYYLFGDHLGSTSEVRYPDGTLHSRQWYKAFGEMRYQTVDGEGNPIMPTNRKYTGQLEDSYINLYWMGSRWYDHALGRFIQPDTIVPDNNNPIAWDKYAYSSNNPINYTDPTGHWPEWFDWLQGATYQYANDMTMGALDDIAWSLDICMDCNRSDAYLKGQDAGRVASTIVASTEQVVGPVVTAAGASAIAPTIGGGTICTAGTGGICALPTGGALMIEGGMVVGGAATALHGTGVVAFTKNNPANGMSNKLNHIFENPDHQLDPLVEAYGGQQEAYDAVNAQYKQIAGNYSAVELKQGITVQVGNFTVTVRGSIVNGDPRIGTFFIPSE